MIAESKLPVLAELPALPQLACGTGCALPLREGELVDERPAWWKTVWMVASVASVGACTYHGYKRNDSLGWAVWWGFMGALFPVVAPAVAIAQGFGQPKR